MKRLEALAARSDKGVRYGPTRRSPISDIVQEPISPELVLVDPELRRKVVARLLEDLLLEALAEPASRSSQNDSAPRSFVEPPEPMPRPAAPLSEVLLRSGQVSPRTRRKRRLAPALLPISLAVNVIVIALSVSDARIAQTSPSPSLPIDPPAPSQLAPPTTKPRTTPKAVRPATGTKRRATSKSNPGAAKRAATVREARGKVEQKVLNTVIQSPAGKLPRALIDPRTGLAKNGLQAFCHSDGSRSFLCVVQPARHKPREGLYVRYYPTREGKRAFTWYQYRRG